MEWLAGALFPAGSPYRVFREKVLPALAKARPTLAGLYCAGNGRPAIEPVLLTGVTLLQFMEKLPDRQASEAVRLHLGWKLALGLEVGYAGFDASSLSVFRGRLVEGGAERVSFDAVLETLREAKAVVLLGRVFEEQFEVVEGRPRQRAQEGSGTVKNPHDPDAQWATKKKEDKKGWVGYKAQVAETVPEDGQPQAKGEPTEQFVTEVTTTEAIASDLDGMGRALEAQQTHGQEAPPELYVDAAYVTDDTLAEAKAEGRELLGPARPCPKTGGVLPADQFDVDLAARQATCPAGKTSTQASLVHDADQGTTYYRFEWGRQCDECPLRPRCTKSESGRRILAVGEHHDLLQARRREMATKAFQARLHPRNAIEGTISELVRLGLRRTRYRGLAKTRLANYFLGAACNVRRWQRLEARRGERAAQAG